MMSQPSTTLARSPRLLSAFDPVVAIVAALTLIGLALRAVGSNSQLWYDEIYSLVVSSRPPLHELLTTYYGDIQHPLYSVLANLSVSALGETAWTVRLPAIVFGVASIPLLFLLGRAVATTHEALLASALLTVSYHHVWFSQNARGYTLLLFLTLLCTLLFYRGLELRRWPPFLCYAVAAALGAYTHLTFVFVVVSHAASVLLLAAPTFRDRRPGQGLPWLAMPIAAIILSGVLTLVFYSPMLNQVIDYYLHVSGKMKALSTPTWALLETLRGLQLGFGSQLVVAAGGLFVGCGLWGYWKANRPAFFLLVMPGIVTGLGLVVVLGKLYPRYLFLLAGFAILIVVRGAMVLGAFSARLINFRQSSKLAQAIGIASIVVLVAASAASLGRVYGRPKQDFAGAMQFVESERQATEPVLTAGAAAWPIQHYYERDWPQIKDLKQIESFGRQAHRVWLVYTFPRYIEDETPGLMDAIERRFRTIRVFPGTLENGDVVVCVKDAAEPASS
jgi:mannosyltransferase